MNIPERIKEWWDLCTAEQLVAHMMFLKYDLFKLE